jgi:hypothetical protein
MVLQISLFRLMMLRINQWVRLRKSVVEVPHKYLDQLSRKFLVEVVHKYLDQLSHKFLVKVHYT